MDVIQLDGMRYEVQALVPLLEHRHQRIRQFLSIHLMIHC